LAGQAVELGFVEHIEVETIRTLLRSINSSLGSMSTFCLPSLGAEFVAVMEDVLDLYSADYDPRYPTVCLDEKPVVWHAETRPAQPAGPGRRERRDYEYVRQGTANLFVLVEPLAGWCHITVTAPRTKADYAAQLRYLADVVYS
jgi:hypothetical protein